MTDRIHEGLQWLAGEFSATPDEFRKEHHPGGDMLLAGLLSRGFANAKHDRVAVSEQGRRRLTAMEQPEPERD